MKKVLYKAGKHHKIYYISEHGLIEIQWFPVEVDYTDEQVCNILEEAYSSVFEMRKFELRLFLVNTQGTIVSVSDKIADWFVENITPRFENSTFRKIAFVMPDEGFTYLQVQKYLEKVAQVYKNSRIQRKKFYDYQEALNWLLEEETG